MELESNASRTSAPTSEPEASAPREVEAPPPAPAPESPAPRAPEDARDETRSEEDRRAEKGRDDVRDDNRNGASQTMAQPGSPPGPARESGPGGADTPPAPQKQQPPSGGGPRENWGGGGGGGGGNEWGYRKKFKKDKFKNKFFNQGGGGGGGGPQGPRWRQPVPSAETPVIGALPDPQKFTNLEELSVRAAELAGGGEPLYLDDVAKMTHGELVAASRQREIPVVENPGRAQLLEGLIKWASENKRPIIDRGHLDLTDEGHGFVVHGAANYRLLPDSTFVPAVFIRKFGLKRGLQLDVQVQPAGEGERCPAALLIQTVMGGAPDDASKVVPFEELTPYYPTKRLFLEVPSTEAPSKVDVSMRCVDILTPIGFGQRGLIVAPPRTGKTILLQGLANSVATNHPGGTVDHPARR